MPDTRCKRQKRQGVRALGTGRLPIVVVNHVRQGVMVRRLVVLDVDDWRRLRADRP